MIFYILLIVKKSQEKPKANNWFIPLTSIPCSLLKPHISYFSVPYNTAPVLSKKIFITHQYCTATVLCLCQYHIHHPAAANTLVQWMCINPQITQKILPNKCIVDFWVYVIKTTVPSCFREVLSILFSIKLYMCDPVLKIFLSSRNRLVPKTMM